MSLTDTYKTYIYVLLFSMILLFSCSDALNNQNDSYAQSQSSDIRALKHQTEEIIQTIPANIQPVFGYRFVIDGDFDGNGKKEKLSEHFFSGIDHKETNKFYDSLSSLDQMIALNAKKQAYSFLLPEENLIDTLHISSDQQQLGLAYLKNEGDLNGDGTDEVSFVIHRADVSALNTWHLMTYKNNKWIEIYKFSFWEWDLPELPIIYSQNTLSSSEQSSNKTNNDNVYNRMVKNMQDYKGLIKKVTKNKIQVVYVNDEAELDTIIVDLSKISR